MERPAEEGGDGPRAPLARSLATGRIHSAYLLSGPGQAPREAALWFVRGLACEAEGEESDKAESLLHFPGPSCPVRLRRGRIWLALSS